MIFSPFYTSLKCSVPNSSVIATVNRNQSWLTEYSLTYGDRIVVFSNLKLNNFWFKFVKKERIILSSFDLRLVFDQKVGENVDFCQKLQNNPKHCAVKVRQLQSRAEIAYQ